MASNDSSTINNPSETVTDNAQDAFPATTERFVYINNQIVGLFSICSRPNDLLKTYFGDDFFERVGLRPTTEFISCNGKKFSMLPSLVTRNEAARTVRIDGLTTKDFTNYRSEDADSVNDADRKNTNNKGKQVNLPILGHSIGLWQDSSNHQTATAQLDGRMYTEHGMFLAEGSLASENGKEASQLQNLGWRRHISTWDADASVGVLSPQLVSSGLNITGVMIASDAASEQAAMARRIEGFAEVPGRIQIRSAGLLLKEIAVPAGNFSLPAPPSQSSVYTLTLVDDAGNKVRTWEIFAPSATRALASGVQKWGYFAGQINTPFNNTNGMSFNSDNLGGGGYLRRGLGGGVTLEGSAYSAAQSFGAGVGFDYEALPWLSLNGGATRSSINNQSTQLTNFAGFSLMANNASFFASWTENDCVTTTGSLLTWGTERSRCLNLNTGLTFRISNSSSVNLRHAESLIGPQIQTDSFQLSTSLTPKISLNSYGTQTTQFGVISYSAGIALNIALGNGQLNSSYQSSGPNTDSISLSYSDSVDRELRYSLSASSPLNHGRTGTYTSGSMFYTPWHGYYAGYLNQNSNGSSTLGLNETGALALIDGHILPTRPSSSGYAIIRLPELPNTTIEDTAGFVKTITNDAGIAIVPIARGEAQILRVAAEDLPLDLQLSTSLIGVAKEDWLALEWKSETKKVHPGWARLIRKETGAPVRIGSMIRLEGVNEPAYVLNDGEVYFSDLPPDVESFEVRYPGDEGRCVVVKKDKTALNTNINSTKTELQCVESLAAN